METSAIKHLQPDQTSLYKQMTKKNPQKPDTHHYVKESSRCNL